MSDKNTMQPEDVLEMAAAAMALHHEMSKMASLIQLAEIAGQDVSEASVPIPAQMIMGMAHVMHDMLCFMQEHKLFDEDKVRQYMKDQIEAHHAKNRAEGKPEGWCEHCQEVHTDDDHATSNTTEALMRGAMEGPAGRTLH